MPNSSINRFDFFGILITVLFLCSALSPVLKVDADLLGFTKSHPLLDLLRAFSRELLFLVLLSLIFYCFIKTKGRFEVQRLHVGWYMLLFFYSFMVIENYQVGNFNNLLFVFSYCFLVVFVFFFLMHSTVIYVNYDLFRFSRSVYFSLNCFVFLNILSLLLEDGNRYIRNDRMYGLSINPISLSYYLVIFYSLSLLFQSYSRGFVRLYNFALLLILLYLINETGSRGGLLCLSLTLVCWFFFKNNIRLSIQLYLFLAVSIVLSLFYFDFSDFSGRGDTRTHVWIQQIGEFMDSPLVGSTDHGNRVSFGESSWFGSAAEGGVIGFFIIVFLMFAIFYKVKVLKEAVKGESYFMILSFGVLLFSSFFESSILALASPFSYFILFVLILPSR